MSEMTRAVARGALGLGLFAIVTVGVVAVTHALTAKRIADNHQTGRYQALAQVLPDALHDNDLLENTLTLPPAAMLGQTSDFTAWRGRRQGQVSAVILPVVTHSGYSGDISLLVGIATSGKLTGVRVLSHHETPGLGDKIESRKSDWIERFNGLSLGSPPLDEWAVKKDGGTFDAFTGATITPRAVVAAVRHSLEYVAAHRATLFGESQGEQP